MAKEKNQELNGMEGKGVERVSIPEIDQCVEKYVSARDKRQEHLRKEVVLKTELIQLLKANAKELGGKGSGEIVYHWEDEVVVLSHGKEKLKVKSAFDEDDENEED